MTDFYLNQIQVLSVSTGALCRKWGSYGQCDEQLQELGRPTGVALSPCGQELYVADGGCSRARIQVLNAATGAFLRQFGSDEVKTTAHIALGARGGSLELYVVANAGNTCIQVFNATTGELLRQWGSYGSDKGQFNSQPTGLAFSAKRQELYVSSCDRIQVFDAGSGAFRRAWGSAADGSSGEVKLKDPRGLALSPSEAELLVADSGNDRVAVFDAVSGAFLRAWRSAGNRDGHFKPPAAVAISPDGRLACVAYSGRSELEMFS